MLNFSYFKIALIACVCFFAVLFTIPTFVDTERYSFLPDKKVNLGLDLRGGSYLLLEVDFKHYLNEQLNNLKSEIRSEFRENKIDGKRIGYRGGLKIIDNKINISLTDANMVDDVKKIISKISTDIIVESENSNLTIGYSDKTLIKMRQDLIEQSIEIVRRRVDETGTREPDIQRQGDSRILLQVPGLEDPEQLKRLLGKTAKLTFHLLDESLPYKDNVKRISPPSTRMVPDEEGYYYPILKKIMISGDLLVDAQPGFGQTGNPVVNIRFNNLGAKKFAEITQKNVDKPFAIILDGKVITAPYIRSAILGGRAEISGNFTVQEAADLAILLRAGSLPAPLDIIEERTVGPSLGADSIEAGKGAIIVAIILVMLFMVIFYKFFGLMSNVALIANMLMITASLAFLGATLTLPGIAGIVLTMGMAVDANILIFERIKEEVRLGKTPFAAVDNGFSQAFKTILDSNITTLIAALLLYIFGSGPIKGFAVTLSIGILASMFSAILLTRLLVVTWLKKTKPKKIVI